MLETKEVLQHHLDAFGAKDIDALMIYYTEDSIILTQDGQVYGLDNLRVFFINLFQQMPNIMDGFELFWCEVKDDVA